MQHSRETTLHHVYTGVNSLHFTDAAIEPSLAGRQAEDGLRTGHLDLSGELLDDFSLLGSRAAMKHLSLAFTEIRNLSGLLLQLNLKSPNLDSSDLQNLKNCRAVANLSSVALKDTRDRSRAIVAHNLTVIDQIKYISLGAQLNTKVHQWKAGIVNFHGDRADHVSDVYMDFSRTLCQLAYV
jgi:hypothetical protein